MSPDEKYMHRCLELANHGAGLTSPNPMVGSVIVYNDTIIGEGYHNKYGGPHAEVNAINSVKDASLLKKSRLYVNLEPCAHHGKTPPCSDLIIEKGIPEVVIGCVDSFSEVSGKGIEKMEKAGIKVTTGVLEKESRLLNRRFFTFHEKKRPYIVLKWAQTLDGFMDLPRKSGEVAHVNWITDSKLKMLVHQWRTVEDSILIGAHTALNDNPMLNNRDFAGMTPIRLILQNDQHFPDHLNVLDGTVDTIIYSVEEKQGKENLSYIKIKSTNNALGEVIEDIYNRNIQSLIVEGGRHLIEKFIVSDLWDEARVFIGNKRFTEGLKAPHINRQADVISQFGKDKLLMHYNF